MNTYLTISLILISSVIILITLFILFQDNTQLHKINRRERDIATLDLKKNLRLFNTVNNEIREEDVSRIEKYSFDPKQRPHSDFQNWQYRAENLGEFIGFAIVLLWNSITIDNEPVTDNIKKYLKIVEDIITRLLNALSRKFTNDEIPWGDTWRLFWIDLPTLFSMYQIIGTDDKLKRQCHRTIIKLIPSVDLKLKFDDFDPVIDFINMSVPRLVTNYFYNHPGFIADQKNYKFTDLKNYLSKKYNKGDEISDGIYQDLSAVMHDDVINYGEFFRIINSLQFPDFYAAICSSLNLSSNLYNFSKKLIPKLLHPSINYTTLGLMFSNAMRTSQYPYWGITGTLGVFIFPFGGIGLFKTDKFSFSVKIQQSGIASFEKYSGNIYSEAPGWIQLRKIYFKDKNYADFVDWNVLKNEPGIISYADDKCPVLESSVKKFYSSKSKCNFIGRLNTYDLLFWRSEYFIDNLINCHVLEVGIVTDNGLESIYRINNRYNVAIKFQYDDKSNSGLLKCSIDQTSLELMDGCVSIQPGETVTFNWRMLIDDSVKSKMNISAMNNFKFEYRNFSYLIESQNMPEYFTVKQNDEVVLLGSSIPTETDSISYESTVWERDIETMMYEKRVA
ncbi:uncharacterized protein LOC128667247 [Microplitis demolitor]|uniref:uncharacterized protein LOC128667247 n=1 Tax=Microplitis demolitor TaxID=69319 RepID=UPI00235B62C2|nr:uncharacterized protein LOC128667247 [Microplitis demolitor]